VRLDEMILDMKSVDVRIAVVETFGGKPLVVVLSLHS
jgi:hypothetical protein